MTPKYILPTAEDNVAIVPERLEAGETFDVEGSPVVIEHAVLQGHRICARPIAQGESLLSWGLPFGTALSDIAPGDYICNKKMREVLLQRNPSDFPKGGQRSSSRAEMSAAPRVNFENRDTIAERMLPEAPEYGANVPTRAHELTFPGYFRSESRGWGTRNFLAVIGTTSHSRAAVLAAAEDLADLYPATDGFDGVVPVVHTEGGGAGAPHNAQLLLRTLAGFAVNPNVGAAVFVGDPEASISNRQVLAALNELPLSPQEYTVRFCQAPDASEETIASIVSVAKSVARRVVDSRRTPAPMSALKVGMQCGGSDAFSGVSANQVLGRAMDTLIDHGGAVGIAETDELIGSEVFTLARVRDETVTEDFLAIQQRFKDYAQAHGHTAEGNVSGGNIYRGLYNITLKSLGAARKKDPKTAIDYVIDYAEPMDTPGFYFMDSPGNDLESVAGQIASGANLIIFTTGNGSITNFPFVPTIKVVTTTARFRHLESDMDYNAGRILEGHSMEEEGQELFDLAVATASGKKTRGEGTRQSQTQIWRNWHFAVDGESDRSLEPSIFTGEPLVPLPLPGTSASSSSDDVARLPDVAGARFDLILPTSLCSGQVGEQIARTANGTPETAGKASHGGVARTPTGRVGVPRAEVEPLPVVALSHTEGCGVSSGDAEDILRDTLVGYADHPLSARAVFLEHGCEKTHNDFFRSALQERGLDAETFGWASIQGEGGIARVSEHVLTTLAGGRHRTEWNAPARPVTGISTSVRSADKTAGQVAELVVALLHAGSSVIIASDDPVLSRREFRSGLAEGLPGIASDSPVAESQGLLAEHMEGASPLATTLSHSGVMAAPGLHIMDNASADWLETATGLGATGATALIVFADEHPRQPHRFVPTIQVGTTGEGKGMDAVMGTSGDGTEGGLTARLLRLVELAGAGEFVPATAPRANVGFQVSRGRFGVSL